MTILDKIEKLINEHGSASILREHVALLREQLAILDKKILMLVSENEILKTEKENLKSQNEALVIEKNDLRGKIQKYEQPHKTLLDKTKTDILLYIFDHQHSDPLTFHIAQSLDISEVIAKYHLEELQKNEFIKEGLPVLAGQQSWGLKSKGKKYLIENKIIT